MPTRCGSGRGLNCFPDPQEQSLESPRKCPDTQFDGMYCPFNFFIPPTNSKFRYLKEAGIDRYRATRVPWLSPQNIKKRLKFAKDMRTYPWHQVCSFILKNFHFLTRLRSVFLMRKDSHSTMTARSTYGAEGTGNSSKVAQENKRNSPRAS